MTGEPPPPGRRRTRHRRKGRRTPWRFNLDWKWCVPLVVFAAMAVLAPLLFGAVDRVVQVLLVLLLTVGLVIVPPAWPCLSRGTKFWLLGLAGLLVAKELAPAALFGGVAWRGQLEIPLPWTHHPEPARVLDAILVVAVAVVWFQWVRTLASDGQRRVWMAWILAGAGVLLAVVCFLMKVNPVRPNAIYGVRETEGWIGWGPFPNRNHTSSFLAMAAVALSGCMWWAFAKRKYVLGAIGSVAMMVTLAALLTGKSRGGLLAFGAGLGVFLVLVMWRRRDRTSIIVSLAVAAVAAAGLLTFGTKVLARFSSEAGVVSTDTRLLIWREAARMWKDAPIFGHGVETFSSLFPLYLRADLDGKTVLHPESSWLQWLTELGFVPLALLVGTLAWFMGRQWRVAWAERRSFFLTAGLFAGAMVLLAHALIDVPGHRWATAGFALALLATAFPIAAPGPGAAPLRAPRGVVFIPAGVGLLWILPFLGVVWSWSAMAPTMLLNRETRGGPKPTLADWDAALRWYPLDPWMREYAGERALADSPKDRSRWSRDFAAVRQLASAAFWLPMRQAAAVGQKFPAEAIPLWQDAIDRASSQRGEVLRQAVHATKNLPGLPILWMNYIKDHPQLGLVCAQALGGELKGRDQKTRDDQVRAFFDLWWENCANDPMTDEDAAIFYGYAAQWSTPGRFESWMTSHAQRRRKDLTKWLGLLHGWKKDERAWQIYSGLIPKPEASKPDPKVRREVLEARMIRTPGDALLAMELAELLEAQGDLAASTKMLLQGAAIPGAPARLLREAAYRLAEDQKYREAIEVALRETIR